MRLKELEKKYEELGWEIERLKFKDEWPVSWQELDVTPPKWVLEAPQEYRALWYIEQLLKAYNGDWEPDFIHNHEWGIAVDYGNIEIRCDWTHAFMAFDSEEKAEHFLKHHRDLIEKAKPLL